VRRNVLIYLQIAIVLIAVLARVVPGPRTIDDAYITYRYASNLIDGQGMVYNPGERVLGTTTPLYTLLMAAIGFFFGGSNAPFPWISLIINTMADAATCLLLIGIGQQLKHQRAGITTAALWAIAPMSVTFAIGGMETSVFVALMTGTFYLYSRDKLVPAAFLASLSLVTRPDSLLFILPLLADRIRRILPWTQLNPNPMALSIYEGMAFLLPSLSWYFFAAMHFGNPFPNSIAAKIVAYDMESQEGFIRLLQHYATPFLGHLTFGHSWIMIGLILFTALFLIGGYISFRTQMSSWAIFIFPITYFVAFSIANPLIFRWYLTPPLPMYFLAILIGVDHISQDLKKGFLFTIFSVGILLLTLNGWTITPDHGPKRPAPEMAFIKLELLYEQVGKDLKDQIQSDETLAAGDIGALGYFTRAKILDTVGLISPSASKYYPLSDEDYVINYAISSDLILKEQPEYLVTLEVYGRRTLFVDPEFQAQYRLIKKYDTDLYGSDGMLVFQREE
jgi:hypothetical protein